MNEFHEWSDDLRAADFDRLVDGALSLTELREMIETFDRQPHLWRQCALAFLEAQALEKEIGGLLGEDDLADALTDSLVDSHDKGTVSLEGPVDIDEIPSSLSGTGQSKRPSFLNGHRLAKQLLDETNVNNDLPEEFASSLTNDRKSSEAVSTKSANKSLDASPSDRMNSTNQPSGWMTWSRRFAVAASLALAFIVGIVGRTWLFPDGAGSLNRQGGSRELGQQSIGEGLDSPRDETTLVGSDSPVPSGHVRFGFGDEQPQGTDEPSEQLLEVPFYSGTTLPAPTAIGLDAQIKDRLEQSGVQINSERQIVSLRTQDGRTVLVPLETLEFVPRDTKRRFQ